MDKYVISKRNTLHLTSGKEYKVIDSIGPLFKIKCDTGSIIETHIRNFLPIEEVRELKLNQILG